MNMIVEVSQVICNTIAVVGSNVAVSERDYPPTHVRSASERQWILHACLAPHRQPIMQPLYNIQYSIRTPRELCNNQTIML